ncbi:MAG: hypothetical protein V4617_18020 [Gemmatimonadota bacterium]
MISTRVTVASAAVLMAGGVTLLFGADAILPRAIPGFPRSAAWLGQLLAAGWIAIAMLNWSGRSALLGGIYGRAIVMTNVIVYFVSAAVLLRPLLKGAVPGVVGLFFVPVALLAATYFWLLMRGPFARDFEAYRNEQLRR